VQPVIFSSAFSGSAGPVIGIGATVDVTFSVSGTTAVPTVTLFNGARTASTSNTGSPYTFTYAIQAGDNGAIVYRLQTAAQGNSAAADVTLTDSARFAGTELAMHFENTHFESVGVDSVCLMARQTRSPLSSPCRTLRLEARLDPLFGQEMWCR